MEKIYINTCSCNHGIVSHSDIVLIREGIIKIMQSSSSVWIVADLNKLNPEQVPRYLRAIKSLCSVDNDRLYIIS